MAATTTLWEHRRGRFDTVELTEEETLIRHGRELSASWERALLEQIMRDLPMPDVDAESPAMPVRVSYRQPNPFLMPSTAADGPPLWAETPQRRRHEPRGRRRSVLPWLVVLMVIGIAAGLYGDRGARKDIAAELHGAAARIAAVVAKANAE
jgi:hypothetical protein